MSPKRINILTLGCSKNTVDTEHLLAALPADAFDFVPEGAPVDVQLVNTCGFIADAKEESIQAILSLAARKAAGEIERLVVFGCLSQRYPEELKAEIPEVDAWFGARELEPVVKYLLGLAGVEHAAASQMRHLTSPGLPYAYLKISEGCDRRCSYCAIPLIRGRHRSVPVEKLVSEARELASKGIKELIVIAQDTTWYGLDLYGKRALGRLLHELSEVEGIEWIRLHYSYPDRFPVDVLDEMAANPKICKYIDIPLQHIADRILDDMDRGCDGAKTRALVASFREKVPGVVLRTTMIVGYPGETEAEFGELLEFVRQARFERLGAFTFSPEEGTKAGDRRTDDVPEKLKKSRLDALMGEQAAISSEFNASRVGTVEKVLVDAVMGERLVGRSQYESPEVDGEIIVSGCPDPDACVGRFIEVRITAADDYDLEAEFIKAL